MKRVNSFLLLTYLFSVNIACNKHTGKKDELNIVINHYSKDPKDSLKLKAAKFLIQNLDGLKTLDTASVATNEIYFNLLDSVYTHHDKSLGWPLAEVARPVDSLNKVQHLKPTYPQASYVDEKSTISADFLIHNIDKAFYVWQTMPWAKSVTFKDFCEYILPYRCTDTYSLTSRDYFLSKYGAVRDSVKGSDDSFKAGDVIIRNVNRDFSENFGVLVRYPYLSPIKFSNLLKGHFGACEDANSVRVTALRSLGIPAALDEIPNWGNHNESHYNYKIVDPTHDTIKSLITNKNVKRETQHIFSASSYDEPDYNGVPDYAQVSYVRSVPKVYRRMFSIQAGSLGFIKGPSDDIPAYFKNSRLKDVTKEYVDAADVRLDLRTVKTEKFVYLCVFDNQRWIPVSWATVHNSKACFTAMGKNIVYLPVYYRGQQYYPAGSPFFLDDKGTVKPIEPMLSQKEKITAYAKFPCRTYVLRWLSYMIGGRFQLANKADLSDTVTVHKIKYLPYFQTVVKIKEHKKYRYLIYQFKGVPTTYIAEIAFYGLDASGKEVKLNGKVIGNPGQYPYTADNIINGKREDLYKDKKNGLTYVGIDLGQGNTAKITKIVFNPYSDDNSVVENDIYKLFYWGGNWVSLGLQRAGTQNSVTFNGVPKNALLLLKDMNGGVQQRIFIYKNGKQVFW